MLYTTSVCRYLIPSTLNLPLPHRYIAPQLITTSLFSISESLLFLCYIHWFVVLLIFIYFFREHFIWAIFKVFIKFVTIVFLFYVLTFWLKSRWDLNTLSSVQSLSRVQLFATP